jgi:hypothetical protein
MRHLLFSSIARNSLTHAMAGLAPVLCVLHLHAGAVPPSPDQLLSGRRASPQQVHAGIPFIVRDQYGTQVCISSRSGQTLPPFVVPNY